MDVLEASEAVADDVLCVFESNYSCSQFFFLYITIVCIMHFCIFFPECCEKKNTTLIEQKLGKEEEENVDPSNLPK